MDRLELVEEHVRCENAHDLDGVMSTFGSEAAYDDEPWDEHHAGHGAVRDYYRSLLGALPDLHIGVQRTHSTADAVILEFVILGAAGRSAHSARSRIAISSRCSSVIGLPCMLLAAAALLAMAAKSAWRTP
jgi:SnoaL-like protein